MDEIRSQNGARNTTEPKPVTPSYRFMLRPWWIASHVLAVFLIVLFVNLGFWQLRRHDERRDANARIEAQIDTAPQPLPPGLSVDDVRDLEWSPVSVEGTYRVGSDVLIANRSLDQQPGYWVITPLEPSGDAPAVAVVRGFVSRPVVDQGDLSSFSATDETVTVTGYVQRPRSGGRFATGLPDDALPEITRPDVEALGEQWGSELEPLWLLLATQEPPSTSATLIAVPPPDLGEGSHLSYAVQWFLFASIGAVGYVLILRRNARARPEAEQSV